MEVRISSKNDTEQIAALFEAVFNKPFDHAEWTWKYDTEGAGYVLVSEGRILGHTGYLRRRMTVHNSVRTMALRVDTMVHPDARGKGAYRMLLEESIRQEREAGITGLYGFPSDMAKGPLIKVTNAKEVSGVPKYRLVTAPVTLASLYLPFIKPFRFLDGLFQRWRFKSDGSKGGLSLKEISDKAGLPSLPEETARTGAIQAIRDQAFFEARYLRHPDPYRLYAVLQEGDTIGLIVTKTVTHERRGRQIEEGRIIDMALIGDADWSQAAHLATTRLADEGAAFVQLWAMPGSVLAEAVKEAGFSSSGSPMTLVVKELNGRDDLGDPEDWHITMGDVDSY
ncbi:GNAT family N-acetyltransferase [Salisediminibacterium selenitireducens]|uniref:N-acetyltransferase domain-containing protein n=1 Tax=Bacillus selenitireducens (strain ATCC 700615 / DSM 15326 / MLS10) TaxID=439292 RepID=D6Y042_BACIE|nr:GNAT family N-acetyltransferase [Salisediminibacterium selenitireducens]ADI00544.1 hypothetical protein Bsel_3062 [[Bacillus] selenitireducens MLS10]